MHTRTALLSMVYSVSQISLGLLVHPYQTMQMLVEEKVFAWMTLLPTLLLAVVTIAWRQLVVPLVQVVFSCQQLSIGACDTLPFISNWITFFMVYWQILLLYLLFRFWSVWRD